LIWLADIFLLLSVWLLGRKDFKLGWISNMVGCLLYVFAALVLMHPRHYDIASFNGIVALMGGWNLWKILKAK